MTVTVEIAIPNTPDEAYDIRDWMYANVGNARLDNTWNVRVRQQRYVFEFEDEKAATMFLLRWG